MRAKLVFLILIPFCFVLTCCNRNGAPYEWQIEAALNDVAKAKNPAAVIKLGRVFNKSLFYEDFEFSCTNCVIQHTNSEPVLLPSCEGHGILTLDAGLQKWKFDRIVITYGTHGVVLYKSDHIF
ncbi:MAG: hypothetical protein ACJ8M4_07555 [Chthoniobacterales bacterium]